MLNQREFDECVMAASFARVVAWGYGQTLTRDQLQRLVEDGARQEPFRAGIAAALYRAGMLVGGGVVK